MIYEWVIIGGGVHATTIALQLRQLGLSTEQLRIIDPHPRLMAQFDRQTQRIGMRYLRSPLVHHCHPEPFDLKKFARKEGYVQPMKGPYQRPRLDMFFDHSRAWIDHFELERCHICQKGQHIVKRGAYWEVTLAQGQKIQAQHVVLAMGTHHTPLIPEIFQNQPDVQHIHSRTIDHHMEVSHVVGSGISAGHLVIKLITEHQDKTVHLWMKKPFDIHHFDADPAWLGPKNMKPFEALPLFERMRVNKVERHKGSMPRDMYMTLKNYEKLGRLVVHHEPIEQLTDHHIIAGDTQIKYDGIYLATGFVPDVMTQPLIQDIARLPEAQFVAGYPQVSKQLEWVPQIYVSGMLADLALGPFARNIMGGRQAALRIGKVYLEKRQALHNAVS
ncbi:FAD/NAD(P)-binding protein [Staphylococcus lutrae]|uniref:L-lysine N6-monooxygenase MbtG n=1 Tax=Staphylococcus lutrae TaxID=155085 RepID=A0AAC9RTQ2_9STAP|nr:FAD/NAD(P)-binding protein [Staphylococcus lutrae]ARJ50600.1 pyridine nucleotide-disulfide oxidoreductase [Staphylococcus lutrae]PNZ37528.1 pyridine nucleotide-disulfide oxidoreductase [Staphylococcus lutrae]